MVLQLFKNAGLQIDAKGIQHMGVCIDFHCADLNDLAAQSLLGAVIIKGFRLIADIPFQIKYDQIHRFKAHFYFEILALRLLSGKRHTNLLYRIYAAKKSPAD